MTKKNIVIQVLGPTGVGKSGTAVKLAQKINGEIISADSMQVYKHFDIGTAKISEQEKQNIPHFLIDILDDCSQFNASIFLEKSFEITQQIIARGHVPIVCGGTALYLRTMIKGIFPQNKEQKVSRDELKEIVNREGPLFLWNKLNDIDPGYAAKIGKNDTVRIIRAMEIYYNSGLPPSEIFKQTETPFKEFQFLRVGLNMERAHLYRRIEKRVDHMIEKGLVEEVKKLKTRCPLHCPPFKSVGYKEILLHLNQEIDLKTAVNLIKQHTRNFAKRQLSWFRQEKDIHWFDPGNYAEIEDFVLKQLT
ncbi:MAG: tRNA (adenosine(37)-N6)-dimethylallyltransferase MiaA [Candidatus Aminicenantes bacterium]|nr:tRNA (adenosine(37)-N6)-dimethylallyltransferase MiaA [Candidatus Aminicenantes bacterium]